MAWYEGELCKEFSLVNMQVGSADTACLDLDLCPSELVSKSITAEDTSLPEHRFRATRGEGSRQDRKPPAWSIAELS